MKKGISILGTAAAIVALAPWKVTQEEEQTKLYALTWEAGISRDADGKLHLEVKPGLHDPRSLLQQQEEETTDWQTPEEEPAEEAAAEPAEAEAAEAPAEPAIPVLDPEEAADYADVPDPYAETEAAL